MRQSSITYMIIGPHSKLRRDQLDQSRPRPPAFVMRGQVSAPSTLTMLHLIVGAAEHPVRVGDVVGDDQIAAFFLEFRCAFSIRRSRFRPRIRPPRSAGRSPIARFRRECRDFRSASGSARPPRPFQLLARRRRRRANPRPRRRKRTRRQATPHRRRPAFRAPSRRAPPSTPRGSASATGPLTSVTSAPAARAACGDRVALQPRGAIADETHGIDRLVCRAGRDHDAPPASAPVRRADSRRQRNGRRRLSTPSIAATIASGSAIRPGPNSPHAISPSSGPTNSDAVGAQRGDIALGRRMQPHAHVHRRRDQHALVGRQQRGRGQIVGEAVRHARQQIGGRGRDDDEIGRARQFDVAHLRFVGQAEQILAHRLRRSARPPTAARRIAWRRAVITTRTLRAALAQPPDQFQRLVSGDAAADDQQNAGVWEVLCDHSLWSLALGHAPGPATGLTRWRTDLIAQRR